MISLIVAYDKNKCIGNNNTIPWKIKADMKRVKNLTTNQTILMGRKTFESIGKALPNRINRVLTNDKNFNYENIEIYNDSIEAIKNIKTEKLFIFGGSEIYKLYLKFCEELYITEVDAVVNGDSYFPNIDLSEWELVNFSKFEKNLENEFDYSFYHYKKIKY